MRRILVKGWSRLILGLLLGSALELSAQTVSTDSINILSLMEEVEKNTSYKIFTNMTKPFKVKKQDGSASLEQLQEALKGTFWQVNVYGQKVFVMQDFFLQKDFLAIDNIHLSFLRSTEALALHMIYGERAAR